MTTRLNSDKNPAVPTPADLADMDAMVRRVSASAGLETRIGKAPLDPVSFGDEREICQATKDRLERLVRNRSALHGRVAARRPSGGYSASLRAVLGLMADEVATMPETAPSIIDLAEAEIAAGALDATPDITVVVDACGSNQGSIDDLVAMLICTMEPGKRAVQADPAKPMRPTANPSDHDETKARA